MGKFKNLTGLKFNRWTVLQEQGRNKRGQSMWLCKCECGNTKIVSSSNLQNGTSKSCGCLRKESLSKSKATHKGTGTRLYEIYYGMRKRCLCKTNKAYKDYGARGIDIAKEWIDSFEAFRDWALSNGYQDNLTIDRIDNDKGYYPHNCQWATMKEQSNNRRIRKDSKKSEVV